MVSPLVFHIRETSVYDFDKLAKQIATVWPTDHEERVEKIITKMKKETDKQGVTLAFEWRPETKKYTFPVHVHGNAYSMSQTTDFEITSEGWYVAFSTTTYKDHFCRKIGREIAVGRLKCYRKDLAYYFGKEQPTYDDAASIAVLLLEERYYRHSKEI